MARTLGIAPSRLSRALGGTDPYPFDAVRCLRLARATGENPSEILRIAGKAELADLIESLYGAPAAAPVHGDARELLERFAAMNDAARAALLVLAKSVPAAPIVDSKMAETAHSAKKRKRAS